MTGKRFKGIPPGGGGGAALAYHPSNPNITAISTDTSAARISPDGTLTNIALYLGIVTASEKHIDALEFQADGQLCWGLSGSGSGTDGGLCYTNLADTTDPDPWVYIGPRPGQAGFPWFNGSGGVGTAAPSTASTNGGYARHYGNHFKIDEVTTPGKQYFFMGTVNDGIYRWRVDKATHVVEEQVKIAAGQYITWFSFPTFGGSVDYSRMLIGQYNLASPQSVLLCTNPNTTAATPAFVTTTVASAGTNTLDGAYVEDGLGGNGVTIVVGDGKVLLSKNAHNTVAGSITWTSQTTSTTGAGPETAEYWLSCQTNIDASGNYVFHVGTKNGGSLGALVGPDREYHIAYRGVLNPASALTTTAWTSLALKFSGQVLNAPGQNNHTLLDGQNSPGNTPSAVISAWRVHPVQRNVVGAVCRGAVYFSGDYGATFYASASWGNPEILCITSDPNDPTAVYFNSADFPLISSVVGVGAENAQMQMALNDGKVVCSSCAVSWVDGAVYTSGYYITNTVSAAGHSVPDRSGASGDIAVWRVAKANVLPVTAALPHPAETENTATGAKYRNMSFTVGTVFGSVTETGTGSLGRTRPIRPGLPLMMSGTNPAGTTDYLWAGGFNAGRLWHFNAGTAVWSQVTASDAGTNPFQSAGTSDHGHGALQWDAARKLGFIFDRDSNTLFRVTAAAPTVAVPVFFETWSFMYEPSTYGNLSYDSARDVLWITVPSGVYRMAGASIVTARRDKTATTATGFQTYYSPRSEQPGQVFWDPTKQRLYLNTIHATGGASVLYPVGAPYPSRGPRWLTITDPDTSTQWEPGVGPTKADDTTQDPNYNLEMPTPHGGHMAVDGKIYLSSQGNGVLLIDPTVANPPLVTNFVRTLSVTVGS